MENRWGVLKWRLCRAMHIRACVHEMIHARRDTGLCCTPERLHKIRPRRTRLAARTHTPAPAGVSSARCLQTNTHSHKPTNTCKHTCQHTHTRVITHTHTHTLSHFHTTFTVHSHFSRRSLSCAFFLKAAPCRCFSLPLRDSVAFHQVNVWRIVMLTGVFDIQTCLCAYVVLSL